MRRASKSTVVPRSESATPPFFLMNPLHLFDLQADGGLCQIEMLRRFGEAAEFADGDEGAKRADRNTVFKLSKGHRGLPFRKRMSCAP